LSSAAASFQLRTLGAILASVGVPNTYRTVGGDRGVALVWGHRAVLVSPGYAGGAPAGAAVVTMAARASWAEHIAPFVELAEVFGSRVDPSNAPWRALYGVLRELGVHTPPTSVQTDVATLSVAWPKARVALLMPGDAFAGVRKDWRLVGFPPAASLPRFLELIQEAAFAMLANATASTATNPSSQEQVMMAALLAAGLPMPRRDVVVNDVRGRIVCQPDDGVHWHFGRHVDAVVDLMGGREGELKAAAVGRFERDAAKRRTAVEMGWTVITCTDTEVDAGRAGAVAAQVARIYSSMARR
jgi:hypothetical protein